MKRASVAALLLVLAAAAGAAAEPVDLMQGEIAGSGFGFRRGDTCTVVTALHVVGQESPVSVADRTGGRSKAERTYDNAPYDLALVTLPSDIPFACTTRWPDVGWLRQARFDSGSRFEAIRHYPNGRETILVLRFVGRTETTLTLAPVDRMNVRESDSGSIVMFEGKPAGIVQRIDPATDRIEVLRFDVIDQLVGSRFRVASERRRVALEGVFRNGRAVRNWTIYARAWLEERAGALVVDTAEGPPACRLRAEVIGWQPSREPNPAYAALQQRLRTCGAAKALCTQLREELRKTPAQWPSNRITLDVAVVSPGGRRHSRLVSSSHVIQGPADRETTERVTLQEALAAILTPLFADGACG